jgi:hypothetical protein
MTVNERLFVAGLMAEWDQDVLREDREKLTELSQRVELADQASVIIESVLRAGGAGPTIHK